MNAEIRNSPYDYGIQAMYSGIARGGFWMSSKESHKARGHVNYFLKLLLQRKNWGGSTHIIAGMDSI